MRNSAHHAEPKPLDPSALPSRRRPGPFTAFKDTLRRVNSRDYAPDQIAARASVEIEADDWKNRFEGRFAIVAELQRVIAGFVDLTPEGYFDRLFVSADHHGQGHRHGADG